MPIVASNGRGSRSYSAGLARSGVTDMRRVLVVALALSLVLPASAAFAAGAAQAPGTASIAGSAQSAGRAVANATVRLRDVANGQLAGTTTANAAGQFSFVGLNAGNYVVEVVNAAGEVIGTSSAITLAAGAAATGVGVSAAGAVASSLLAGGSFFGSTLGIVTIAAVGAAVTGVTVAAGRSQASPSK